MRGETEGKTTELRMEEEIWGRVEERPLFAEQIQVSVGAGEREGGKLANEGGS